MLYVGDENQESQEVCNLIARSQVLLVVAIGLIAVITLQVSAEPISGLVISARFKSISNALEIAYLIQMKLVNVVLTKMPSQIRLTNPYAIRLDQRLTQVLGDIGCIASPTMVSNDISTISDNVELMAFLDDKVASMIDLMLKVCHDENRNAPQHTQLFETFFTVIRTEDKVDFMQAKDTVVQEVHAIQNETELGDEPEQTCKSSEGGSAGSESKAHDNAKSGKGPSQELSSSMRKQELNSNLKQDFGKAGQEMAAIQTGQKYRKLGDLSAVSEEPMSPN